MKSTMSKVFSMICVALLVFSTLAPSLASAVGISGVEMSVNAGSDTRTIQSVNAYVNPSNINYYSSSIELTYDSATGKLSNSYAYLESSEKYLFQYVISYLENGQTYHYVGEKVLTGAELDAMTELSIPTSANLKVTKFEDDSATLNYGGQVSFEVNKGFSLPPINILDVVSPFENIVVDSLAIPKIKYVLSGNDGTFGDNAQYALIGDVDFTKVTISTSTLEASTVKITHDLTSTSGFVDLQPEGSLARAHVATSFNVTPGVYKIQYSADNNGNLVWEGSVDLTATKALTLPTEVSGIKLDYFNYPPEYTENISFNYNIQSVNSAGFVASSVSPDSVTGQVLDAQGIEIGATVQAYLNSAYVTMPKVISGTYQLKISATFGGQTFTIEQPFEYKSAYNLLQGTPITAEATDGTLLTDAKLKVYEMRENYYTEVFSQLQVDTAKGTLFIPDAYILKDTKYVLVVTNSANDVMYAKEFVGQSNLGETIHFDSDTLKQVTVSGANIDVQPKSLRYELRDTKGRYVTSIYSYDNTTSLPWKLGTDLKLFVSGTAQSTDAKTGYTFENLEANATTKSIDLTAVSWKSIKPSSTYSAATVGLDTSTAFSELKLATSDDHYYENVILNVSDGTNVIKQSTIVYSPANTEPVTLTLDSFTGNVFYYNSYNKQLNTYYYGNTMDVSLYDEASGGLTLTYWITDVNGQTREVTTNNFNSISLTEDLAPGEYKVKLVKSSIDSSLLSLSMDTTFVVGSQASTDNAPRLPQAIDLSLTSSYGDLSYDSNLNIYQLDDQGNKIYNVGQYKYNSVTGKVETYYANTVDITKNYEVVVSSRLVATDEPIMEIVKVSGSNLLSYLSTPFNFSNTLVKLTIDQSALALDYQGVNYRLVDDEQYAAQGLYFYSAADVKNLYVSAGEYSLHGEIYTFENQQRTGKFFGKALGNVTSDKIIALQASDFAKITVTKNTQPLPIFAWNYSLNSFVYMNDLSEALDAYYVAKETYNPLYMGVVVHDPTDSPWGYVLAKENPAITADTTYEFTGDITGQINNVTVEQYGFKETTLQKEPYPPHSYTMINVDLALSSGQLNIEKIYRAIDNNRYSYATGTTNPVEEYYGIFRDSSEVPISYEVINTADNTVIVEGSTGYYKDLSNFEINLMHETIVDGVYTLKLNIPTGPRKSLVLQQNFVVGTPAGTEFVTIGSPTANTVTNHQEIVVGGSATPNATVKVELVDGSSVVSTATTTASAEGVYSATVTAPAGKDGLYTVNAKTGQVTKSINLTVDRIAPEKPTVPTLVETQNGLEVKWTGLADAQYYVVEYAKGTGAFTASAQVKTTSFTIPNVAAETTYKVRVKAYDAAGNASTSDEVSKTTVAFVGAKVSGSVTSNNVALANATVRLKNNLNLYTAQTDASGNYSFQGIKAGLYDITVTNDKRSLVYGTLLVTQDDAFIGVTKTVAPIQVISYVSPVISFTDNVADSTTPEGLSVRIEGPNDFVEYGYIDQGKFVSYSGVALTNLVAGAYTVTVYESGLFSTTEQIINLVGGTTDYSVTVTQENITTKQITLNITPSTLANLESISLYSPSVYEKYGYRYQIGYYYEYNPTLTSGQLVITGVVPAADYELNVSADNYMNYSKTINLSTTDTVNVTLEQGRQITGKVTDNTGVALGGVYVSAYGGDTYYSDTTNAQGEYTLKNLSKTSTVELTADVTGYVSHEQTVTAGANDVTQNITLAKAKSISGKVVDETGTPLTHAYISVSGTDGYSWARTATDGTFFANGLKDGSKYEVTISYYGYPTKTLTDVTVGDKGIITLQKNTSGNFKGDGNYLAISKDTVAPGDTVQLTLAYKNNGTAAKSNVPVTLTLPAEMTLVTDSVQLNGKDVAANNGQVTIPSVEIAEAGKITYKATIGSNVTKPTLTATAQVDTAGEVLSATTSVVFVTLEAPARTNTKQVKVYGTAKLGAMVEVYADNVLVGQQKVDSKWWYATIELPVKDTAVEQTFKLTAKVTNFDKVSYAQPINVTYSPNVPVISDVTVTAGWNGDVKLNPYTGVATFAITEHTWMPTTIIFDQEVDSATLNFLGKTYTMTKDSSNAKKFIFSGDFGRWTSYGEQLLSVTYVKDGISVTVPLMNIIVLIDPSGYVFEGTMDNKLEGVQAVVEVKDASGKWVQWDAAKYGQVNPQVTDADGRYGWDVINGEWRVVFTKEGYKPYISRVMKVPPAETELNVPMVKVTDPMITTKAADVGSSNLTITFDRYMNVSGNTVKLYKVDGATQTEVAGTVKTENKDGYKVLSTVPTDKTNGFVQNDSNNETGFFTADASTKVSKTFTFVPNAALTPGTTYVLKVDGNTTDEDRRTLGVDQEFTFVAKELTLLEKLQLVLADLFSGSFIRADFKTLAEQAIALKTQIGTIADTVLSNQFTQIETLYNKMKNLTFSNSTAYVPTTAISVTQQKQWTVTFSQSVQDSQTNRAKLKVVDMFGEPVDVTIAINNDKVVIIPKNSYIADTNYTLVVEAGLVSGDGKQTLTKGTHYTFQFK